MNKVKEIYCAAFLENLIIKIESSDTDTNIIINTNVSLRIK